MKPVKHKWTCKDGTKIRICDMEDSHILNSIRMIESGAISTVVDIMDYEGGYTEFPDTYQFLCKEAKRRRLDY